MEGRKPTHFQQEHNLIAGGIILSRINCNEEPMNVEQNSREIHRADLAPDLSDGSGDEGALKRARGRHLWGEERTGHHYPRPPLPSVLSLGESTEAWGALTRMAWGALTRMTDESKEGALER